MIASRRMFLHLAGAAALVTLGGGAAVYAARHNLDLPGDSAAPTAAPDLPVPSLRSVNYGMESIVEEWEPGRIADSGANAVSLAVGRPDWVAFPWPAQRDAESAAVRDHDTDYLQAALDALPPEWEITLTIDALVPRMIGEDSDLAGVDTDGERSESFASVAALDGGAVGDRLVELATHLAATYGPDRICLTELMFDDSTFGDDDHTHFLAHTGETGWPRTEGGDIDTEAGEIAEWRSESLARLLQRLVDATAQYGVKIDMDVRAPRNDPSGDRALSGHDYDLLLTVVDRIVVWNYPGLRGEDGSADAAFGGRIAGSLGERYPGRFVMSTGLWADGDDVLTVEDFLASLSAVQDAGAQAVSVTPASLLTEAHWEVLRQVWT